MRIGNNSADILILSKGDSTPAEGYKYHRVLLKLSGEALMGDAGYGIDPKVIDDLAEQIKEIVEDGVQVAITVGGGIRGVAGSATHLRAQADYIGMLAMVMNSLALQDGLERHGVFFSRSVCNRDASRSAET